MNPKSQNIALAIPLVLDVIFNALPLPSLKTARLVCQTWNEVGTTHLGRRSVLAVDKLFPCCSLGPMPPLDGKLVRHISYNVDCASDDCNTDTCSDITGVECMSKNLGSFLSRIQDEPLEEIHFQVLDELCPVIAEALTNYPFAKLTTISLDLYGEDYFFDYREEEDDINPLEKYLMTWQCPSFPVRSSLKKLSLWVGDDGKNKPMPHFRNLFQKLINSAPNLTQLRIVDNFYPDLSTCRKLEVFEYDGFPLGINVRDELHPAQAHEIYQDDETYKGGKVVQMLDQVKDSVVKVVLGRLPEEDVELRQHKSHAKASLFILPRLPKLTSLFVHAVNIFGMKDNLNSHRLPKLQNVALRSSHKCETALVDLLESMSSTNYDITSLRICLPPTPDLISRVRTLFPHVINLELETHYPEKRNLTSHEKVNNFQEMVQIFYNFGQLDHSIVHVTLRCKLFDAGEAVESLARMRGLKTLHIIAKSKTGSIGRSNFLPGTQAVFLSCAAIPTVIMHGLLVTKLTLNQMMDFIKEHNLPIKLEGTRVQQAKHYHNG
ncbi:uncharacterized protein LOC110857662 isoform X2 [Folsomia candida]|uniref:uncharacterized protein LOC110857662 isoform X2 n=1 Tax=Folsomia candida TaxID=158441 RepID=UPI001604D53A|nr:uncharacterized protein LOC110857662 isoform X2 [Folsomia candida]